MKRIAVNIVMVLVFAVLIFTAGLFLAAKLQLEQARDLKNSYRWEKAGEAYQRAVEMDPLNAEYFARAGDFLMRQGEDRRDTVSWIERAEKLYHGAVLLNSRYAEYHYLLGKARLAYSTWLMAHSPETRAGSAKEYRKKAIEEFKKATEVDPYNFRISYLNGYELLTAWDYLDEGAKNFALDRLKYVLKTRPDHSRYIYPGIMYYTEDFKAAREATPETFEGQKRLYNFIVDNNLWQFRKEQAGVVERYREKEEPEEFERRRKEKERLLRARSLPRAKSRGALAMTEEGERDLAMTEAGEGWVGKSEGGNNTYENGNMYWTGTVYTPLEVPSGKAMVKIQAKGSQALEVWPYMIVALDGKEIGETFVDSPEWGEYIFKVNTDAGTKVLSVTFANDGGDLSKGIDRNLYVGDVKIVQN